MALIKQPKEILATEHQLRLPHPPPLMGKPSQENADRYCDYHGEKGHFTNDCHQLKKQLEMALESGKPDHLIRNVRQQGKTPPKDQGRSKGKVINMIGSVGAPKRKHRERERNRG